MNRKVFALAFLLTFILVPYSYAVTFVANTETIVVGTRTAGSFSGCVDTSDDIDCTYQESDTGSGGVPGNLNFTVGSFGTTTQAATNTVTISGWPFNPTQDTGKFVILWWDGTTETTDSVANANHRAGYGIAVSSTERGSIATHDENGVSPPDSGSAISTTDAVHIIGSNEVTDGRLDFDAWTSDGMRFIIDDQFTANYTIQYGAGSGDDITDIATGAFQWNVVTGTQDITGLGFEGELLIVMAYDGSSGPPATSGDASLSFGVATANGSGNQYAYMGWADGGTAPSDTFSYVRNNELLALGDATAGPEHRANFDSWLADGFRIFISETDASIRHSLYLVINGGQWKTGDIDTRTDTNDIVETGVGFQPEGIFFISHNRPESAADTPDDDARWSMGAVNHTAVQVSMGMLDEDNKDPTEVQIAEEYDNVYINLDETDTGLVWYLQTVSASAICGEHGNLVDIDDLGAEQTELVNTLGVTSPFTAGLCWLLSSPEIDNMEETVPIGTHSFIAHWGADSGGGPAATINIGFYTIWLTNSTIDEMICEIYAQDPTENADDEVFSCISSSTYEISDSNDHGIIVGLVCNERCTSRVPTFEYNNETDSDSRITIPLDPNPPKGLMRLTSFDSDGFTTVMSDADSSAAFVYYLAGASVSTPAPTNYTAEVQYDWTGVPAADNHTLIVEGTSLSAIENVTVFMFNFTGSVWNLAYTMNTTADFTYDTYNLSDDEFNSGSPRVRFNGTLETTDSVQDSFDLDFVVIDTVNDPVAPPAELTGAEMLMWYLLAVAIIMTLLGLFLESGSLLSFSGLVLISIGIFLILPTGTDTVTTVASVVFAAAGLVEFFFGATMALSGQV